MKLTQKDIDIIFFCLGMLIGGFIGIIMMAHMIIMTK